MKLSNALTCLTLASTALAADVRSPLKTSNIRRNAQEEPVLDNIISSVDSLWETIGLEGLTDAVAIDSLSPYFNPEWATTGEIQGILDLYLQYATDKLGSKATLTNKTYGGGSATPPTPPLLSITVQGSNHGEEGAPECLFYTHADTQPHTESEWTHGDPLVATRVQTDGDLVFGRGTTDDKYAFFASIIIIETLIDLGLPFPTIHIVVDTEEEGGSPHLEPHLDALLADIGQPELVYVLDSGGPDLSHMWNTRTLRGLIWGVLRVELLDISVHSGTAGGIVPSVFRLMNNIIEDRLEDRNGTIIAEPLVHELSESDKTAALSLAEVMGATVYETMPWIEGASPLEDASATPTTQDIADMLIRNAYESSLAVIGWDHAVIPALDKGGNIVQPYIEAKLSIRLSPYTDANAAGEAVKQILETPPHAHGTNVTFTLGGAAPGFAADPLPTWYKTIVNEAAVPLFGAEMLDYGMGGTIGFLDTIQKKLEGSIIHNTGLFAPASKGHAPDENLDMEAVKKFTSVMTYTIQSLMTADFAAEEPLVEVEATKQEEPKDSVKEEVSAALPVQQTIVGLVVAAGSLLVAITQL